MRIVTLVALTLLAGTVGVALAQERRIALKEGAGLQRVEAGCGTCHSLDYIVMNSPFLDRAGWDGEVRKMVNVFGAPIAAADQQAIVDYLAQNYGKP